MPKPRTKPEVRLTNAQFEQLAGLARIPQARAKELREILDREFTHYLLSKDEFKREANTKTLLTSLTSICTHSTALLTAIDRHPDIRARLVGLLMVADTVKWRWRARRARKELQHRINAIEELGGMATLLLRV